MTDDEIRLAVRSAIEQNKITAYEIAKRCDGQPTQQSIRRYLLGLSSMGIDNLAKVCRVVGIRLRVDNK